VAKGGITATLPARCAILAAANPTDGRFSKRGPNQSVMRSYNETGLPPPLASRFDIIWMIRDEIRVEDDERIARHMLKTRTKGVSESKVEESLELNPTEGQEDQIFATGVDDTEHLTIEFLRKFIAYAKRNIHPDLNEDAKARLLEYYTDERQSFSREDQTGESEVIPITPRALEALIRLTEAHARMHLREVATVDDADVALAVFRHWREESGIEDESELYSGVSARVRNANAVVRQLVRDICVERDGKANLDEIYSRAASTNIPETTVDEVLSRMRMSGELFSPTNDVYSFAR